MYISYDDFSQITIGEITEEEYIRIAPMADAIIDDWTLGRVGKAVNNNEELPQVVKTVYTSICEHIPSILEGSKGNLISSFSNGVDDYTFEVTPDVTERMQNELGWMAHLLPVEWYSGCVSFEGGNEYAG